MMRIWIRGERSKEKLLRSKLIIWTCISLSLVLTGKSVTVEAVTALQADGANNAMQGKEISDDAVSSSSERTSNAIVEAEEAGFGSFKKSEKTLTKPYPYLKLQESRSKKLDNSIRQSKRSNRDSAGSAVVGFNGTIFLSVSDSAETANATDSTESTESADLENLTTPINMPSSETSLETTSYEPDFSEDTTDQQEDALMDWSTTPYVTTAAADETSYISVPSSSPSSTVDEEVATSDIVNNEDESTLVTMHSSPVTTTETVTTGSSETTSSESTTIMVPEDSSISTVTEEEESFTKAKPVTPIIPITDKTTTTENLSTVETSTTETSSPMIISNVTMKIPTATTTPGTAATMQTMTVVPTMATTMTTEPFTVDTPLISTRSLSDSETVSMTSVESEAATTITVTNVITLLTTAITTPATTVASSPTIITTSPKTTTPMTSGTEWTTNTKEEESVHSSTTSTDATSVTSPTEDATLFIRIVLEGGWDEICSKLPDLQQSLAELLNNNVDKKISSNQVIFHQTQCSESATSVSLLSEVPLTSVLLCIVDEKGSFDESLTKILPRLYQMAPIDFPLTIHSFVIVQETDAGNAIAVVIVSCVAFICLILLAGLLFIMRKRQGRFNYGERCRPVSLDAYSLDSVSAYNSVRRSKNAVRSSKRSYGNPTFEDSSAIPSHPLNFAGITSVCSDVNALNDEFASIPQVSSKIDELPAGVDTKNRYANVIPLPETRVPLQMLNNDPTTEYINASYVRGPKNANKYYIACQAPTEQTVSDFWRMIWEQQCKVIIMLTDLVENGVEKCCEYIPPLEVSDCHRLYGDFQVTLKKREAKEKYAISTLHLKNLENNTFREVSHIWYLWPANGVPTDGAALIAVLLEARALQRGAAGPIVVHCSPGTGRTGTLIALDLSIRQYEITRTVDVPRVVYTIRRDRAGAVQTREQYIFIYKALSLYASKLAGGVIEASY